MSAPSNGYVHVKIWVLNNSKVYSFLQAPPIHYFLYAYVHLVHTHTVHQMHSKEMKRQKQMETTTQMLFSHSTNNTLSILHFLTAGGSTPHVIMFRVQQLLFSFFLYFCYMRLFLVLLEYFAASIAKFNCPPPCP